MPGTETTLLTDFDGVIAPFGWPRHPVTTLVSPGGYFDSAFVLNGLPHVLHALHTAGRIRWTMLSSWGAEVTAYLAGFDLPTPVDAITPGTVGGPLRERHGKAAAVEAMLEEGPVVWVDDLDVQSFREECADAVTLLDHPRLLVIETDSAVGLTPDHLHRALAFADSFR
ncbi:hypothetical protein [Microbacterium sp. 77mftsu3.1]|uniref:hypothetical protein n=1 Tax=Microbacterium sp. 77mftsu3.1 TaxID=1761802 RepID=UPI00036D2D95|nr:hypothetical protein [Microbacterium sp. 77mftsu3.1]SDH55360.1 hypothetical protein SAMN04488590_3559 [Microbacterium sp. 77mftsu3.1]